MGSEVYAHPTRTGGKICTGFQPSSSMFFFSAFHVRYSSMNLMEINYILKILIPKFIMMVLFLRRCLSFAIFWSLRLCNIASLFFLIFIIAYLFLYIYLAVAIFYDVIKFELNLFL